MYQYETYPHVPYIIITHTWKPMDSEQIKAEYFITETVVSYIGICTLSLAKLVAEKFGLTFVHSLTQNHLQDEHLFKTDTLSYSLSFFSSFRSLIYLRRTPVFYRVVTVLVRADCTSDDISSIGVVEWVPAKS